MRRHGTAYVVYVLAVVGFGFLLVPGARSQYGPGNAKLQGMVKSAEGKAMEGVVVSAREAGKSFTTSVFTDSQGAYSFPRLEPGKFAVWAQAVGFDAARSDLDLKDNQNEKLNLELKPLQDFHKQLSASEWLNSIPDSDQNDARMKQILVSNCTGCHQIGFLIQNRFDEAGWGKMINLMERFAALGYEMPEAKPNAMMVTGSPRMRRAPVRLKGVPFSTSAEAGA